MPLAPGARLGPYEIKSLIGSGGMGEVYRAHDSRLDRDVALKVLPSAFSSDRDRLRRFEQEARAAAALNHPNILAVYDIGTADNVHYVVSELLQGRTLRDTLSSGCLHPRKAIDLAIQIAHGLAVAHDAGVVHRDLKPENLFITHDGRVKILDFGLAKLVEPVSARTTHTLLATRQVDTVPGLVVGTVGYMSPEQVRGRPVDYRSDIFTFGAILYEMLGGERAFTGESPADVLSAVLNGEPAALIAISPMLPGALDQIVQHCLEKDPGARFQSTGDLVFVLVALSGAAPAQPAPRHAAAPNTLIDREFRLSETVCRKLDRASLDARIIGDELHYLDNGVQSDIVVCYLHGMGLDARDFEPMLRSSRYRGLAVTMYGFEPHARRRLRLSLVDHATILREWLRSAVLPLGAARLVLVGFSAGADVWMQLIAAGLDTAVHADGLLTLDCNLSYDTSFVSRVIAKLPSDNPGELLAGLRTFGEDARSLGEWLNTHDYLVKVFRKFQSDVGALTSVAREVVRPFDGTGLATFIERYKTASGLVPNVRFVFSDLDANRRAVAEVHLHNLDAGALGDAYREDSIVIEPDADHFDLLDVDRLTRHLDAIVSAR
jgi:hypothetical protein